MARIACGHCGGVHGSVAEVRSCSLDSPPVDPTDPPAAPPDPAPTAGPAVGVSPRGRAATGTAAQPVVRLAAEALAGPDVLGRSVVVGPDQPPPGPWRDAERIRASVDAPAETVERLHRAWRERTRLVIEWDGPLPDDRPTLATDLASLGPDQELPGERLRFAVTANAVDARARPGARADDGADGADGATLAPLTAAARLGATVSDDGRVVIDGQPALVDGGPLDDRLGRLDQPVVPRAHLQAGLMAPLTTGRPEPSADLAPDQLAAVTHAGGPARIIAPAGSGKTRVLTERTRHLVLDWGVRAPAVSLVAYNRRARTEMRDRLAEVAGLEIRTLNSLALSIITGAGGRPVETIDEIEARRLLGRLVPGRRRRQLTDPLEAWIDALSACRLGLRDPHEVEAAYGGDVAGFADVVDGYRHELRRRDLVDYDEQVLGAIETLATDPDARERARSRAPVLLVDEFQDLTPAHLLLIRLLAGPAAEVFAVGDDDQTIYGYTGASPRWLVDFEAFFPGAADHPLTVNYRCPPAVVTAAVNLLSHNEHRVDKTITAARDGGPEPALAVNDETNPLTAALDRVSSLLDGGADPGQVAVLGRVNAALLAPLVGLIEAGHPVRRPPGVDGRMLDRSGIGAALAWLRLAADHPVGFDPEDLRLVLRRPPRSLHPRIADWVCEQRSVVELERLAGRLTSERDSATVASLAADVATVQQLARQGSTTVELLRHVYDVIGLKGAASQLDESQRTARRAAHGDDLDALAAVAALGPDLDEFEPWLRARLGQGSPPGSDRADDTPAITVATIHATKGLEWDHVIVHDVRGDLHPHRLATDIEEERRIFHVALTRARSSVLVNGGPASPDRPPSPFVAELDRLRPAGQAPSARTRRHQSELVTSDGKAKPAAGSSERRGRRERAEPTTEAESRLRAELTEWRLSRSRTDGVPAYVVIDNATLDAIAAAAPTSLVALGRIKGIGPTKLDRYGDEILGIVAAVS